MPTLMADRTSGVIARGLGDPGQYLLADETVVVGVRRHLMVLSAAFFETLGFIAAAFMIQLLIPNVRVVETITLLIALGALLRFGYLVLEWRMERFVITNQRMMLVGGVLTRRVAVMPIRKVTDLTFEKPLVGQILGYGTFVVESAGQDQAMSRIEFLPQANRLYLKVSDLLFGDGRPSVDADLVTDPPAGIPSDSAMPAYDLERTDPNLGAYLAGIDYDDVLPSDRPNTDRLRIPPPSRLLPGMSDPSHESGRMRQRLGGLNGRGRTRESRGETGLPNPIDDHLR